MGRGLGKGLGHKADGGGWGCLAWSGGQLGGPDRSPQLPDRGCEGGSVSAPREQATGQEGTAPGCARAGLGWIWGKMSSGKGWPGMGTGCPGRGRRHHPGGFNTHTDAAPGAMVSGGLAGLTAPSQPM